MQKPEYWITEMLNDRGENDRLPIPIEAICEKEQRFLRLYGFDVQEETKDGFSYLFIFCMTRRKPMERYTVICAHPGSNINWDELSEPYHYEIKKTSHVPVIPEWELFLSKDKQN